MNNKNNPFDYKNFNGNNYKINSKLRKIVISSIIIIAIITFGKGGFAQPFLDIKLYNIYDREINDIFIYLNQENITSDFFIKNNSPSEIEIVFSIKDALIENDKVILDVGEKTFISLKIYNVTAIGNRKVNLEGKAR